MSQMLKRRGVELFCCIVAGFLLATGCEQKSQDEPVPAIEPEVQEKTLIKNPEFDKLLIEAAYEGKIQEVRLALEKGADVNAVTAEGRSALMLAAFNGHVETIKLLLDRGAKVDTQDLLGRTALMYSASGPYPETVEILLDHGADADMSDGDEHFTALMFAAAEGQVQVVEVLLGHKANFALIDVDGDTALVFARNKGHAETVQLLEKAAQTEGRKP